MYSSIKEFLTGEYQRRQSRNCESVISLAAEKNDTKSIRNIIPFLIESLHIKSFIDFPCGDLYWIQHVNFGKCKYTGIDFSYKIITENKKKFEESGKKFISLNNLNEPLPQVDLIFCRSLILRLEIDDIKQLIDSIKKSKSKYLITDFAYNCNHPNLNTQIKTGGWRPVNLCSKPFYLPEPLFIIPGVKVGDDSGNWRTDMGLWSIEDIRYFSFENIAQLPAPISQYPNFDEFVKYEKPDLS